jgi:hypothetical protein
MESESRILGGFGKEGGGCIFIDVLQVVLTRCR